MTNVVPFKSPLEDPDTCLRHVRRLAEDTGNISFDVPHFRQRLEERDITMRQVIATIRKGELIDGPKKDHYGDWRVKLQRRVAGRKIQVVLAVDMHECTVVTVI